MHKFIKDLFSSKQSVSSKRVCGFAGWIVCLLIAVIATIKQLTIPVFLDTVLITSATLLGLDSVTNIWKQGNKYNNEGGQE